MPPLPRAFDLWVGAAFSADVNGVLILGESSYEEVRNTDPPLCEYIPSWCRRERRDYTFSRICNAFAAQGNASPNSPASAQDRERFWATVAFTNFVQQSVGSSRDDRPTPDQFRNAALELPAVLHRLKPRGVLILGKEQAVFSAPVMHKAGIPEHICPHPAGWGVRKSALQFAWHELQAAILDA